MHYRPGAYSTFTSDMQSIVAPNVVVSSLDFEPSFGAYAVSYVETTQTGAFDYRLDPVVSAGPSQKAGIQAQATLDGAASRIITAVSFDASGNANLISYGWTGDTTTVYDTQTMVSPPDGVASAVTALAGEGYIISAFGGNDADGYSSSARALLEIRYRARSSSIPQLELFWRMTQTPPPTSLLSFFSLAPEAIRTITEQ